MLEVFLKHAYTGFSRSYADDIAVIALKSKVTVSVVVSPVCMNWKSRFNIPNGSFGKVNYVYSKQLYLQFVNTKVKAFKSSFWLGIYEDLMHYLYLQFIRIVNLLEYTS